MQTREQRKKWEAKHRTRLAAYARNSYYMRRYGIPAAEVDARIAAQDGRCPICTSKLVIPSKKTHLDHCHRTSKLRGILCNRCNLMLGYAKESVEVLRRAIKYLEAH